MLVFIHINKTAGRTLRYILRSSYGTRHCDVEPWHSAWEDPPFSASDLRRLHKLYPELQSIAGHRLRGYVDLEQNGTALSYFTFMRDPLKTCASRFQFNVHRKNKHLVFEEWIQQDRMRNIQTKMIAGSADAGEALRVIRDKNIFVGLAERFDESIVLLKALRANDLNISYQRVNVASDNSIKERLLAMQSTRQMLIEANRADIELYDFVANELYPSYQQEYGPTLEAAVSDYQRNRNNSFNKWNLTLSRMKQHMFYQPLLYLSRRGVRAA